MSIDRRAFIQRTLGAATALVVPAPARAGAPAILPAQGARPAMPQGVAAGDVGSGQAVIWSRADRPARMFVEYSTTEAFRDVRRVRGPAALDTADYTARTVLAELPAGQRIFYRVLFQDLADLRAWSVPSTGSFLTEPTGDARDVTIAWSADTVGQGWGINPEWGGLRLYETIRRAQPDVFVNCGDTIYADQPLVADVTLDSGATWKNLVTEEKSKAAETLGEFRGNHRYNLLDEHMRRFNADVPQIVTWDDHEVRDNWYETRDLGKDDRYLVKSTALLAARARQALFEYTPLPVHGADPERIYRTIAYATSADVFVLDMRSYRGANSENRQPTLDERSSILGAAQLAWIKERLLASRATWKVMVASVPLGVIVRDFPDHFEAVANADAGAPLGRELELAELLRFIKARRIPNVVWITGDVHYCAAHHYDPSRARFTDFDPFWEFVAGPLNAGTFGPNELDPTFGPDVKFIGIPTGMKPNRPPSDGLQFFGLLRVDRRTRALTASLHDLTGTAIYRVELPASR